MQTLNEFLLDSFFSRIDAGELIPLPFDVRCSGCDSWDKQCPFRSTARFRSDDTCYWNPSARFLERG